MPLNRVFEDNEVANDLRQIYADVRATFDTPWVPTVFKVVAGTPEYLDRMWDDLGPVARSKEFQSASRALEEFIRSLAVSDGWHFQNQQRMLAAQKFSQSDIEQLGGIISVFVRAIPRLALFLRLMQRGFSGGQKGRVSNGKQASAIARMITLNVPNEKEAGIRAWLIYNDIKKTTGSKYVVSMFRVISPYPGYMASVWQDSKKLIAQPNFNHASEELARRTIGLIAGMPVKDHRKVCRSLTADQWREIEELVDSMARLLPRFALIAAVWQRSFPHLGSQYFAA